MRPPLAVLRLVHPFPSILDGIAVLAIGLAAGGPLPTAIRLGLSMTLIQFAIGAVNDMVDAAADSGRTDKPLAIGAVSLRTAAAVAVTSALVGLALASGSGPDIAALAAIGLGLGLGYDLRLKRTAWAWAPLAVAIPLLVVFAWVGATREFPPALLPVALAAGLAGASLAIGNGLVDPDRDRIAGVVTPVVRAGAAVAWRVAMALLAGTVAVALGSLAALGAPPAAIGAAGIAGGLATAGLWLTRAARPGRRERGWELQAIAIAALGAIWVAGVPLR